MHKPPVVELSQLVEALREEGVLDSEGAFSVGLAEARRKFQEFQSSTPERYLTLIVSAGIAAGASAVEVLQDSFELVLTFTNAYVAATELLGGFEALLTGQSSAAALDLMLGLHGAFPFGATEVEVEARAPGQEDFRWTLQTASQQSERIADSGERYLKVTISPEEKSLLGRARGFFRDLRGYAGMSPECRLLDSLAEFALVPIKINGELVNRGIFLPHSPVAAVVGEPGEVHSQSEAVLRYGQANWSGAVAIAPGELKWVVSGLTYPGPSSLGLSGVIFCDDLRRDISRERVAQDEAYRTLLSSLEELKAAMVVEGLKDWADMGRARRTELLDALAELTRRGRPTPQQTMATLQSLFSEGDGLSENTDLCMIWAKECEMSGDLENLRVVATYGLKIGTAALAKGHLHLKDVRSCAYFVERLPQRAGTLLEWLLLVSHLSVAQEANDAEEWLERTEKAIITRYGGHRHAEARRLLIAVEGALTYWYRCLGFAHNADHHFKILVQLIKQSPDSWLFPKLQSGELSSQADSYLKNLNEKLLGAAMRAPEISALLGSAG